MKFHTHEVVKTILYLSGTHVLNQKARTENVYPYIPNF